VLKGRAVEGTVLTAEEGRPVQRTTILGIGDSSTPILMVLTDDGNEIKVMEGPKTDNPLFYSLTSVARAN
jgi:hypothetical protein